MRRCAIVSCCILLAAASLAAAAPVRDHVIVPEDYFTLQYAGSLALSTDGRRVAWIQSGWADPETGRMAELWADVVPGGTPRRLTFDLTRPAHPVWSEDGAWIWFDAKDDRGEDSPPHDGSRQVWRIHPDGTGLTAVTRVDDGVGHWTVARDGGALIYTVGEEHRDDAWKDLKTKWKDLEYGHGVTEFDAVRRLDLDSWRDAEIVPAKQVIRFLALSPDGARLALQTTPDRPTIFNEGWSHIEVVDLATGDVQDVTPASWRLDQPSPYGWLTEMAWSEDGRALAFAIDFDGYASQIWVAEWRDGALSRYRVRRPGDVTLDGGLAWRGDGRTLCWRGEDRGRVRVYQTAKLEKGDQGDTQTLTPGDLVVTGYALDRSGRRVVFAADMLDRVGDVYNLEKGTLRRLTDVNPQMATWILPQISDYTWTGGDGDEIHGILELPAGYDPGADGPLPAIVQIHGGPTSSSKYRFKMWMYGRALMAANGYALLSPNYHGSTGYGDAFLAKLVGRENEIEVADIAAGTEKLIADGIAKPGHIGVMGWSNGGFLTNAMIVARPDLYAAASSGAGVLDMVIQWGTEDTPGHVVNFMEGLPWENPDAYRAGSPLYGLDKVTTPTLIHVGGDDARVPPAHSRALFRALYHYLNVPVELVVYPGEGHNLNRYDHRLAKMEWDLAWFSKYLKQTNEGDGQ